MAKELKLKVRKIFGLIPTFVEVAGEKLGGGGGGELIDIVRDRYYLNRRK